MDKGKNRTDLLAAGRKKLQQFRKQNKGSSSSHGKSSGKAKKLEKDADAEEPLKVVAANPVVDADVARVDSSDPLATVHNADVPAVPPVAEEGDGVVEEKGESEELPRVIELDGGDSRDSVATYHEEANSSGVECNGESYSAGVSLMDSGVDDANEDVGVVALVTDSVEEDLESVPSLNVEVAREVDGSTVPSEDIHEGEGDPTVPCESLEVGVLGPDDPRVELRIDGRAEQLQEGETNISDKPEESTPFREDLEIPSLSQDSLASQMVDDAGIANVKGEVRYNEGEARNNEDTAAFIISASEMNQREKRYSAPSEELLEADVNVTDEPVGCISLELPSSSKDIACERDDHAVTADAEGEGRNSAVSTTELFLGEDGIVNCDPPQEVSEVSAISLEEKESVGNEKEDSQVANSNIGIECVREHLYLTNVAKDVLRLQLNDQTDLSAEYCQQSSDVESRQSNSVEETQHSKSAVSKELAQCRSELQAMAIEKAAWEVQCHSAKEEIAELRVRVNKEESQAWVSDVGLESFMNHLYLTNVGKDVLQLHLAEQTNLNEECCCHSSDEVTKLWDLVKEAQERDSVVRKELEQCRSELRAMAIGKEELELRCLSTDRETEELHVRASELQSKLEWSQEEMSRVFAELSGCRGSLEALQKENMELTASLNSEIDAGKKLMEEKDSFSNENGKLVSELMEQKEKLLIALEKQVQLQRNLGEAGAYFEQLAGENLYLSSSLDIHKAKIKELDCGDYELPLHAKEASIQKTPMLQSDDHMDTGYLVVYGVLKGHLEEANNILQNLEKSIEGMHSHSVSLSRSAGRVVAPGVSKLIQAFESKVHLVETVPDEMPLTDGGHSDASYLLTREQTSKLRYTLRQIELDMGKADVHLMKEQSVRALPDLFKLECEIQRQQNNILCERPEKLIEKLSEYESKIVDLETHINLMKESAMEEAVGLTRQVELLQKEVNESISVLKQEGDSVRSVVFEAIERLHMCSISQDDDNFDVDSHLMAAVDAAKLTIASLQEKLEDACLNYNTLHASYEELSKLFVGMQGKNEWATGLLNKFYSNLRELVKDLCDSAGEAAVNVNADEVLRLLPEKCDMLIWHLQKLLNERLHLLSMNNELESELLNKNEDIKELKMRCNALATKLEDCYSKDEVESLLMNNSNAIKEINRRCLTLARTLEEHELTTNLDSIPALAESSEVVMKSDMQSDLYRSLLSRVEALVAFHLQKYQQVIGQINLSRNYLKEVDMFADIQVENWLLPLPTLLRQEVIPMVNELQEKLNMLSATNLKLETEMQVLKGNLSKMEESLEASNSELHSKASELEQSEQRLASVRDKLSMAVAKGKGLIVQRDSLKQSLMEKSSELEKCKMELQSKEELVHEVEEKLKSCSEVERVEALESELSYIRNSATAMRDSFLLKDSVLQRIEEVLEDLDMPEHFHSKDIVEKIELLSRMVVNNSSLTVTDWDQKSSEGHSRSDSGFIAMNAWKDDIQPSLNSEFDDLKRKYDELQSKFYGLAEHNDMLEQSLVERNSLVQKWEEVLDRIDMPSQFRTLEPEDRIECLGRALSEVQQERDSLQHKIENLEVSSDMLIVDLEESHKKISELNAEVVAVKSDKEFFSKSLDKLRFENFALSEKAVHDELERDNMRRELAELQEKMVEKIEEDHHNSENEMRKLHDLVLNALPDSDQFEAPFDGTAAECMERLLRKFIDNYIALSSDKSMYKVAAKEVFPEENNLSLDKLMLRDDQEQDSVALRLELDETSRKLILVTDERDAAMAKCLSFMSEIEGLTGQMNLLQEERAKDMEKSQSLVSELEAMCRQKDALQEQLTQEEQKSALARDKLNVAVRKGKGLVQQRDSLKLTIDELNILVERFKIEHSQQVEALESEKSLLKNRLAETEKSLQDSRQNLRQLLTALQTIDVNSEVNFTDPVQKIEELGRLIHNLHLAVVSSGDEAKKSKRASELLLAELNEVQERADVLQEELLKAEASLVECSKQKHDAESGKSDALSRLEQFMSVHSEEREKQIDNLMELKASIDQLQGGCLGISSVLSGAFSKNVDFFSYVEVSLEAIMKKMDGGNGADLPVLSSSNLLSSKPIRAVPAMERSHAVGDMLELKMHSHVDDGLITEHLALVSYSLHDCIREYNDLNEKIHNHYFSIDQQASRLLESMETVNRKLDSQREVIESLKRDISSLEWKIKEKETVLSSMHRNVSLLYEACCSSVMEIENRRSQIAGNKLAPVECVYGESGRVLQLPSDIDGKVQAVGHISPYSDDLVRTIAENLLSYVKSSNSTSEIAEGNQKELKATISELQREIQEKDIEMNRICSELVSQIREAEAVAKKSSADLDSARTQACSLEKRVAMVENDKQLLESRLIELEDCESSSKELQERIKSLSASLTAKDQEIEALMQALDEEESQMEDLENKNKELENILQEKILALENLEASRAKVVTKLSTTVSKFDELHNLSESLLSEVENLQSQLQGRDSEISFLRHEVTRCTNDVLASQEINKKYSSEMPELLAWMDMVVSRFGEPRVHINDDNNCNRMHIYTDIIDKKIVSAMAELEDLRAKAQSKDVLLQIERDRVEELLSKAKVLETSLHEKETNAELFQLERDSGDSGQPSNMSSPGPLETEQMVQRNKGPSGPIVTHVRSGRKVNNDQIAIAIDMERNDNELEDEDDDKAHGFKSLTMSRLVPRATRPISDKIDRIWVSGERLLMRQPTLRLGFLLYWVALHALLASII